MALYVLLNLVFFYAVPSDVARRPATSSRRCSRSATPRRAALFGSSAGKLVTTRDRARAGLGGQRDDHGRAARLCRDGDRSRAAARSSPITTSAACRLFAVSPRACSRSLFVLVGDLGRADPVRRLHAGDLRGAHRRGACSSCAAAAISAAYRTFGYPVTPLAFIALSIWIAGAQIYNQPQESAIVGGVLVVGAVIYLTMVRGKEPLPDESMPGDDRT